MCKIPTETFFTDVVGLPVTLVPNYETVECQFCYGRVADGTEGEEAGGCYVGCAASGTNRCDETNERTRSFRSKRSRRYSPSPKRFVFTMALARRKKKKNKKEKVRFCHIK